MRFDFYSSRWSQLMLCSKQFRVKLTPRHDRTKLEKVRLTFFLLLLAALASCTPLADLRETNRGESVFVALPEN
jgi:hypothetical protein